MSAVRKFGEKAVQTGCHSIIKDAEQYASELQLTETLQHPNPRVTTEEGDEIGGKKLKDTLAKAQQKAYCGTLGEEKWQGKLTKNRWEDSALDNGGCFAWMNNWRSVPTNTIATIQELNQQMLPTKLYHQRKTAKGSGTSNVMCRKCAKSPESVPHVLAACGTLAQTEYLFEMLKDLELISEAPPRHSKIQPKPLYENGSAQALWDVPVYADSIKVRAKRIDASIVDKEQKRALAIEMSCPWLDNRGVKEKEKTQKYGPLMWELRERKPGYQVKVKW